MRGFDKRSNCSDFSSYTDGWYHIDGMRFTTVDKDRDIDRSNCAKEWGGYGGWFYSNCARLFPTAPITTEYRSPSGKIKPSASRSMGGYIEYPRSNEWVSLKTLVFKVRPLSNNS